MRLIERLATTRDRVRQAFGEFLGIPTWIIVGCFGLAAATYALDHTAGGDHPRLHAVHRFLESHFFRNAKSTSDLLGSIAGGLITVTSITFSVLLLAVQQSASSLTNQVFDQFLRRRTNQAYFGAFVGLSLYTLLILATVDPPYNPVFGAALAFLLTVVAMYVLILLLYSTIDQMRPFVIINAIREHTLAARGRQRDFLHNTRREARSDNWPVRRPFWADRNGFVARVDVDRIARAAAGAGGEVEVVLHVRVGSYVAFRDVMGEVRARTAEAAEAVGDTARDALMLHSQRDLDNDPAFGLEQLHTIAWTSISTAKSNPSPGLLAIRALRDILARWSAEGPPGRGEGLGHGPSPVVYEDDVMSQLMDTFDSLAVVASESMQHQSIASLYRTFAVLFDRLAPVEQSRAEDLLRRSVSCLGEHVLTAELEAALDALIATLDAAGRAGTASTLLTARDRLSATIGRLNSRSTRVQSG